MKENDIVTLINLKKEYKERNLYLNCNGVILKILPHDKLQVIFFNDKNVGDYAVVVVDVIDVKKQDMKLPLNFIKELKNSKKVSEEKIVKKLMFKDFNLKECDRVELLVENEKYSKFGVHKGDVGYVALDYAVSNSVLVDFSRIDENGEYFVDCIEVKIDDLKVVN